MGTNYYREDNNEHVGKLVSNGRGQGCTFIWAATKVEVLNMCLRNLSQPVVNDGDPNTKLTGGIFSAFSSSK